MVTAVVLLLLSGGGDGGGCRGFVPSWRNLPQSIYGSMSQHGLLHTDRKPTPKPPTFAGCAVGPRGAFFTPLTDIDVAFATNLRRRVQRGALGDSHPIEPGQILHFTYAVPRGGRFKLKLDAADFIALARAFFQCLDSIVVVFRVVGAGTAVHVV